MSRPSPFPPNVKRAPTGPDVLEHWLLVSEPFGEDDQGYDNDTTIRMSGGSLSGKLVIWVNDSPVDMLAQAGVFFRINEWLTPGMNHVRITGDFQESLYMKVVALRTKDYRAPDWRFEEILAKSRIKPTVGQQADSELRDDASSLEFNAEIDYSPFFDVLPTDETGKQGVRDEARAFLAAVLDCWRRHDFDAFKQLTFAPWDDRPRWSLPKAPNLRLYERRREFFEDKDYELITAPADIELLCGRYCVLAVLGRDTGISGAAYHSAIFKHRTTGEKVHMDPFQLTRVSGRWEIW